MNIGLNPTNKMTISELNNLIEELTNQRERLMTEEKDGLELKLNIDATEIFMELADLEHSYRSYLVVHYKAGRERRIEITPASIESWHIELNRRESED